MLQYLYVALGSAVGGVARWSLGGFIQRRVRDSAPGVAMAFPLGTLAVNVSGSFLLGLILMYVARHGDEGGAWRLLLAVGFCGGYTTFSTFSADTVALVESGATGAAALNVAASLALSFAATFGGIVLGRALWGATAA